MVMGASSGSSPDLLARLLSRLKSAGICLVSKHVLFAAMQKSQQGPSTGQSPTTLCSCPNNLLYTKLYTVMQIDQKLADSLARLLSISKTKF